MKLFNKKQKETGLELISIHIPKTGGRSVRRVLKNVYGETLDLRHERSDFYRDMKHAPPLEPDLPDNIRAVHAHLSIKQFMPLIETYDPKVICWIRDPVERVISNYYFFMKRIRFNKNMTERQKEKEDYSLMEYARENGKENKLHNFMDGLPLENFFFIGLMEQMDTDIEELREKMGWKQKVKSFHANSNQDFKYNNDCKTQYDDIDKEMRTEIAKLNALDTIIYNNVREMRGVK